MSKCNLIAPIAKKTGNFVLFSQYAEDLTKSTNSEDFYRVVPSKYVLLNIPGNPNISSPESLSHILQGGYENACSLFRDKLKDEWTPDCAADLFWRFLTVRDIISILPIAGGEATSEFIPMIGDINITSTKEIDGTNYSEIYIDIQQGKKPNYPKFTLNAFSDDEFRFVTCEDIVNGFTADTYPSSGGQVWTPPTSLSDPDSPPNTYSLRMENDVRFNMEESDSPEGLEYYEFNSVVVLYDIVKRGVDDVEYTTIYSGIPMGMYFTGAPNPTTSKIENPVKVWISNPDIYEQGTSYGIRICTRYLSTQNAITITDSTVEAVEDMYDQYAAVMSKIGESKVIMDNISRQFESYANDIGDHLANFKNYKVNVPYLREIGGRWFWFVNGKNMGVAAHETDLVWEKY